MGNITYTNQPLDTVNVKSISVKYFLPHSPCLDSEHCCSLLLFKAEIKSLSNIRVKIGAVIGNGRSMTCQTCGTLSAVDVVVECI